MDNENDIERTKRFVKKHERKIMVTAVVYLAWRNRQLSKDIDKIVKASHLIIDGMERLDCDIVDLYERQSFLDAMIPRK